MLRSLNHAGIPRYLDCFETDNSFCLLQEYKDAQPLSAPRSFTTNEIKRIAVSLLEILVYLQSLVSPVTHRDIKPENILVDQQLNVYLVDFGLARIGGNDLAMSSVVVGTIGFMPPEQLLNQDLSAASDLYGLGATLICLLSGIQSASLSKFIDETYTINTEKLLHTSVDLKFKQWLQKMVSPKQSDRYSDAASALAALAAIEQLSVSTDSTKIPAVWTQQEQKPAVVEVDNFKLALEETSNAVIMLGIFYVVLPELWLMFTATKANDAIAQPIIDSMTWMIQINSKFTYISWRLGTIGLLALTLWNFWTKGNWQLSATKTVIFGSSMLFFQYLAIQLQQLR